MANQKTPPCGTSMRIDYYHSLPFQKITAQSSPHNKQQQELVPPVYSSEQVTIITPAADPLCCCMSCHNGRSNFPQKYYYNNNILIQPPNDSQFLSNLSPSDTQWKFKAPLSQPQSISTSAVASPPQWPLSEYLEIHFRQ